MDIRERGSEIVQAVIVVPLVLVMVFATIQVGGMMLSVNRLTADMVRACRQMDTAGLALASNKEAFVKKELLGTATQLRSELLHVSQVKVAFREDEQASKLLGLEEKGKDAQGLLDTKKSSPPSLSQRTNVAKISFKVTYEMPFLAGVPGLAHTTIARHIECSQTNDRIVEVEVVTL